MLQNASDSHAVNHRPCRCVQVLSDGTLLLTATAHNNGTGAIFENRSTYFSYAGTLEAGGGPAVPSVAISFSMRSADGGTTWTQPTDMDGGRESGMMVKGGPMAALEIGTAETRTRGTLMSLVRICVLS